MNISISYHSETVPDYVNGKTSVDKQELTLLFDGSSLDVYSESMDKLDKKIAINSIRSILDLYEKKEILK